MFFETEISFIRSHRSEIHTLREAALRHPFEGLRKDYGRVELGAYFVELLELFTEPDHPVPELYDLMRRALGYLEANPPSRKALLHFESELARLLGIHAGGSPLAALQRVAPRMPEARHTLLGKLK